VAVSVLLRQAHGFEGVLWFSEGAAAEHLSISKLEHPARGRLGLDATGFAAVVNATNEHDDFAHLDAVGRFGAHDLPRIGEVAYVLRHSVVTPVRTSLFPEGEERAPLDIRIAECDQSGEVASGNRVEELPGDLHVLLRNTPSPALRMGDFISRV
jgi:hypothetical protein